MNMRLFGTDGIRGTANEFPITPEVAMRAGKAITAVLSGSQGTRNRVVIGKDTRISGYMLETALTSGLVSTGMDVLLIGPMPTPAVAYLTKSLDCCAGIMLTASHNPYEDNGLKIFGADGYKLPDELEEKIEDFILSDAVPATPTPPHKIGKATRIEDARSRYIEFAKHTADNISLHGLKIVIDCGNGAAYFVAPLIFRELGAEVITMATQPDGMNINDGCGALHPEAAGELVKKHGADLGVSFDGDADRAIFTDAHGNTVNGDRIIALCAIHLKQRNQLRGDTVAVTVMSNLGLNAAMEKAGIAVLTTDVGDRHVIEALRAHDHSFGGENSGHLIFADHATTGDGILSALQVLRIMKESGKPLHELAECMEEYPQQLESFKVPAKPPLKSLNAFQSLLREADAALGKNGRQLIRYSGTENKARVLVEHRDAAIVAHWTTKLSEALINAITLEKEACLSSES
jgi:phosphoglucosamine mutase